MMLNHKGLKDASFITYIFSHNNKKGSSELPCLLNYGDKTLILIFVAQKPSDWLWFLLANGISFKFIPSLLSRC